MKIEYGENVIEDEFIFGMVANSNSVGGMKLNKLHVNLADGLFEVLLIKKIKHSDIKLLLSDLMNNREESQFYHVFKANELKISSDDEISWTLDGEFGGDTKEAVIKNIPSAIKIRIEE